MPNWTTSDHPFIHFVPSSERDVQATQSQGSEPLPTIDESFGASNFEDRGCAINVDAAGQDAQAQDTQPQPQQTHVDWPLRWPPSTHNPTHSAILGAPQAPGSAHLGIVGSGGQQQQSQGSLYGQPYSFLQLGHGDYTREQAQHPQAGLGLSYLQVRYSGYDILYSELT